jgi:ligand-binding sensor domain-containing protein
MQPRLIALVIGVFALWRVASAQEHDLAITAASPPQARVHDATVHLSLDDASDIRFSHLSRTQGLSQTRVTRIVQDDQGFIWFATQYGLDRYDGYRFKVFRHDPAKPTSICGVYIQSLFKDRAGNLWIGCDYELDRYDPAHESFSHYPIDVGLGASGLSVSIRHISQDSGGMLWLSTLNGLYRFDPHTGAMTRFHHSLTEPTSLSSDEVYSSGEDRAGAFWVATAEGLDDFHPETGRVSFHVPIREPRDLSFYEDRAGTFWVFYTSGNGQASYKTRRFP